MLQVTPECNSRSASAAVRPGQIRGCLRMASHVRLSRRAARLVCGHLSVQLPANCGNDTTASSLGGDAEQHLVLARLCDSRDASLVSVRLTA